MKTYGQEGEVIALTAPSGGVVSGVAYLIGSLVVIALVTAAETVQFSALVCGVATVAKTTSQTWSEGQKLHYVSATKAFSTSSGGNTLCGVATKAAGSGDTTGSLRLDGVAR